MDNLYYDKNDMVRIACDDCKGCSECCHDMGQSILLDPVDVQRLSEFCDMSFAELMQNYIEVHMEDGLVMPNLRMTDDDDPRCVFLNSEGRCSIHDGRPGLCRLFPLGRNYEDDTMQYFVLDGACPAQNKTKIKIKKWVGPESADEYKRFLIKWHALTKKLRETIKANLDDEAFVQAKSMEFLNLFYVTPYTKENFWTEIYTRMEKMI